MRITRDCKSRAAVSVGLLKNLPHGIHPIVRSGMGVAILQDVHGQVVALGFRKVPEEWLQGLGILECVRPQRETGKSELGGVDSTCLRLPFGSGMQ